MTWMICLRLPFCLYLEKKKYTHLCLGVLKYLKPVLILTIILAYSNISGAPKYLRSKPNVSNVGLGLVRSCKLMRNMIIGNVNIHFDI